MASRAPSLEHALARRGDLPMVTRPERLAHDALVHPGEVVVDPALLVSQRRALAKQAPTDSSESTAGRIADAVDVQALTAARLAMLHLGCKLRRSRPQQETAH